MRKMKRRPAVFLDRDGTVNREKNFIHKSTQWEWIPGSVRAIRLLNDRGYLVIIVSNQSGVARGYFGRKDVEKLHRFVRRDIQKRGGRIDGFFYCPHLPADGRGHACLCRKPSPGMVFKARRRFGIDLKRSYLVGDRRGDVLTARAAGARPIHVLTGYGRRERKDIPKSVPVADNLYSAVRRIILARRKP